MKRMLAISREVAGEFLLTSGEGWLATADSNGEMERQASSFQWDNHAILVR